MSVRIRSLAAVNRPNQFTIVQSKLMLIIERTLRTHEPSQRMVANYYDDIDTHISLGSFRMQYSM